MKNMDLSRWHPAPALLGAALLALVVRVVYLAELNGSPLLSVLLGDSRQYVAWAQQIAGGQWIGTEIFYQTPLYPYWLAVIFSIAGSNLGLVRLIQAVLGAASCVLLGLAGRRFFNDRVGVIAAMLLAVYPPAFFFDGLIQKSSLDIFLVTLVLALLGEFTRRPGWKWLAASGAVTAAFVLNRENAFALYPVIGAWLLFCFRDVPTRLRVAWAFVFVFASLVVLLPVGFRNYRVGGEFLLSTSQLGPNFYIGNHANALGSYEALVPDRPDRGDPAFEREDAVRLASKAVGRALSPGEVSDYWLRESFAYIRSQPFQWLALLGKKVLLTFNAKEIPDTESIEAYSDYSYTLRGLIWLNFGVILPFAVFGGWIHRRDWRHLIILYGMAASLALAVAVFYVVARYRHPLVPIIMLFSAAGLSSILDIYQRRFTPIGEGKRGDARKDAIHQSRFPLMDWKRQWVPGICAAVLIAIVANIPIKVVHDETYLNVGSLLVKNGRPAEALPLLMKAVAFDPGYAMPHLALGVAFRNLNKPAEALRYLEEAVRLAPDSVETLSNLGLALIETGRPREAVLELQRAISLAPELPNPHNYLAAALHQAGDVQQAIAEYRKALALKADYSETHNNLALALASIKDYDGASRHFRETIRLQPHNYMARTNFGRVLCETGRTAEGIGQLEEAARLAPDFIEAPYLAAQAYARAGRFKEALANLERALGAANATGQADAARQINETIQKTRALMERRNP